MTPEKVLEILRVYRKYFESRCIEKVHHSLFTLLDSSIDGCIPITGLKHCHAILDQIEKLVREGKMEKAFRWLGFIQGVLWSHGLFTLNDLKNHLRS